MVKKDAKREPFDRAKLERAISHSCRKRDIDPAKIDQLVSGVQRQMETLGDEVTSARIGEAVMAGLKALDHVAYIRFASIYKDFSDPGDFAEIAGLAELLVDAGVEELRAIGGMIAEVAEGLRRNGEAGDGQVEQSVATRVRELCHRFPIYQG